MSLAKATFAIATTLLVLAACGGTTSRSGDEGDAGSSSGAGSNGKAGSTSKAGSSGVGGAAASGGSTAMGGAVSVGGSGVGGWGCDLVLCAYPECADGAEPFMPPGQCCPICSPIRAGCDLVMCEPVMGCASGYERRTPPGACCEGCVPKPGGVACPEIACPTGNNCPLGYVRGDALGGCCTDCVPDPNFCHTAADCLIADRPRGCCECPEPISVRAYKADACWSAPSMPRVVPKECVPLDVCPAICVPCPPPGPFSCSENRCVELLPTE
jgi:hypothetical protein